MARETILTPFQIPKRHHYGDGGSDSRNFETSSQLEEASENYGIALRRNEDGERGDDAANIYADVQFVLKDVLDKVIELSETSTETSENDFESETSEKNLEVKITYLDLKQQQTIDKSSDDDEISNLTTSSSIDSESDSSEPLEFIKDPEEPLKAGDANYIRLMKEFRSLLKDENELDFNFDNYLPWEECGLFPSDDIKVAHRDTALISSSTLTNVKIFAPKTFKSQTDLQRQSAPSTRIRHDYVDHKEEKLIRDRVNFLLRTTQSFCLKNFEFINEGDGSSVWDNICRIEFLRRSLQIFLRRHSSTLENVCIRTVVKNPANFSISEKDVELGLQYKLENLRNLEIILWDAPPIKDKKEESIELEDAKEANYWIVLLKSRASIGNLKKLVWMSSLKVSFSEVWEPIFNHNHATLDTIHIIHADKVMTHSEVGEPLEQIFTPVSCAPFSEMTALKSLYLRKSHAFAHRLDLLPDNLMELSLDGLCLESCEIVLALKKLEVLKKLRLVNNNFPLNLSPIERNIFGVNLEVIKVILQHRKLEDVFVWGYTIYEENTQPKSELCKSSNVAGQSGQRKSRSRFQRFRTFWLVITCITLSHFC